MLTEISAKFTFDQVRRELSEVGLQVAGLWTDPAGDYLVTLARPA
jgi:L-histidine N-alpha-methyltransferase